MQIFAFLIPVPTLFKSLYCLAGADQERLGSVVMLKIKSDFVQIF